LGLGNQKRVWGLAVSRAFGDFCIKKETRNAVIADPFVSEVFEIGQSESRVILASDGLWDIITGQSALELIKDIPDSKKASKTLLKKALSTHKCTDNVTVIVINLYDPIPINYNK